MTKYMKTFSISDRDIIDRLKQSAQIPTIVRAIISQKIIASTALELGINLTTEELQQGADSLRSIYSLEKAEDTWSWLQEHHLSLDDFEEIVRNNILTAKLARHLFGDRVELFFAEHILDYTQVVLYEVIFNDKDLAMELFYALQEGEITFAEIADRYIENPELRRVGGYRGTSRRSDLKPEISAAVFAANPPQILKPIVTTDGIHLLKVETIIRPQLDNSLRQKILNDLFSGWLQQQIADVESISFLEDRRDDFNS
jgi:parvulin-like peptidyl-prolyl isomerase